MVCLQNNRFFVQISCIFVSQYNTVPSFSGRLTTYKRLFVSFVKIVVKYHLSKKIPFFDVLFLLVTRI